MSVVGYPTPHPDWARPTRSRLVVVPSGLVLVPLDPASIVSSATLSLFAPGPAILPLETAFIVTSAAMELVPFFGPNDPAPRDWIHTAGGGQ